MRDLLAAIAELRERLKEIPQADERRLSDLKTEIVGRKAGALTQILGRWPKLDPASKKEVGAAENALKREFEAAFEARERELKRAAGTVTGLDLTMPGRAGWQGGLHLVTQVVDEICEIFRELGFTRAVGPEAETERYNFFALNFPKDHPALDAQDSFYLGGDVLLRTHTSPVQIRTLERYPPPIRVVIPGQVYRRDPFDASHSPVFQQIEGLAVDEGISFVDFKATLATFARRFFAPDTRVRFRPSFFPFTEPSAEMEVKKHPDADRLSLCLVDAGGGGKPVEVVCGAPNVQTGKVYPYAPVGAVLPGGLKLERKKIRGVESNGMLCSAKELGLGADHAGILELDTTAAPGTRFIDAMGIADHQIVIDVPANRPDLLCHKGVARELGASIGAVVKLPLIPGAKPLSVSPPVRQTAAGVVDGVEVRLEDPEGAPRYMMVGMRRVRVGPSPASRPQRRA